MWIDSSSRRSGDELGLSVLGLKDVCGGYASDLFYPCAAAGR